MEKKKSQCMSLTTFKKCSVKLVKCLHVPDIDNLTHKNLNMKEVTEREKLRDTNR